MGQVLTVEELTAALDDGRLIAAYQPCYDLRTGALVAVEALARLREPATGDLLPPDRFMPTAEDSGLVARLDLMMMDQAFRQVARWRRTPGHDRLCVAVNLSPSDLDDPRLADRVRQLAAGAGLPVEAIVIELTETALAQAARGPADVVAALGDLGCNLTLDDFGTSDVSLDYLSRFRVDGIKIDRSFVHLLGEGGFHQRLAESLVRFCLSLGVHVVAEGIEDGAQVLALRRLGCTLGQGFFLSRPLTAERLEATMAAPIELPDASPVDRRREDPPPSADPADPSPPSTPRPARPVTQSFAVVVVLLMACLMSLAFLSQWQTERLLREAAQDRLVAVDSLAAGEIGKSLARVHEILDRASRDPDLRRAIADGDLATVAPELSAITLASEEIFTASAHDARGTLLQIHPRLDDVVGKNFAHRDWYVGARATDGPYVSSAFQLLTPEAPWAIAVSTALRDRSGQPVGYLVATFVLSGLQEELEQVLAHHGFSATLIDARGQVLAAPGGRGLGEPTVDPRLDARAEATGDPGADVQWAVRPVPVLGGWLLAEQPSQQVLDAYPSTGRLLTLLVSLLAIVASGLILLWAGADRRRHRLEHEVAETHAWLTSILHSTPTPFAVCDDAGHIEIANPAMTELLDTTSEAIEGADLGTWLPAGERAAAGTDVVTTSLVTTRGDLRTVEVRSQVLGERWGRRMHLHALTDVTPHREEQDRLRAQGRTDPLTGVGNRIALREALAAAAADDAWPHAVVMMDLDGFKAVNDTLGHAVGDDLLAVVASTLQEVVRPGDTVARLGGDEFVVVVRLGKQTQAGAVAERLGAHVQKALAAHSSARAVSVGVSAGAALLGVDGHGEELLSVADQRMYAAKRSHRAGA